MSFSVRTNTVSLRNGIFYRLMIYQEAVKNKYFFLEKANTMEKPENY